MDFRRDLGARKISNPIRVERPTWSRASYVGATSGAASPCSRRPQCSRAATTMDPCQLVRFHRKECQRSGRPPMRRNGNRPRNHRLRWHRKSPRRDTDEGQGRVRAQPSVDGSPSVAITAKPNANSSTSLSASINAINRRRHRFLARDHGVLSLTDSDAVQRAASVL